jgi:DNA-directed RNA polymerase subunit E'
MYKIVTAEDRVRVPPEKFSLPVKESVKAALADKLEGVLDPKIGSIVMVVGVDSVGEGKIVAGDPAVHYQTTFRVLAYRPEMHELVSGVVIDNAEFGSFVRVGPMDGLVHISQIMDDYVSYDGKSSVFVGKESKRVLKEGDKVRARVIAVSFTDQNKLGLTMRQPGLGCVNWIEEDKKKALKKGQ